MILFLKKKVNIINAYSFFKKNRTFSTKIFGKDRRDWSLLSLSLCSRRDWRQKLQEARTWQKTQNQTFWQNKAIRSPFKTRVIKFPSIISYGNYTAFYFFTVGLQSSSTAKAYGEKKRRRNESEKLCLKATKQNLLYKKLVGFFPKKEEQSNTADLKNIFDCFFYEIKKNCASKIKNELFLQFLVDRYFFKNTTLLLASGASVCSEHKKQLASRCFSRSILRRKLDSFSPKGCYAAIRQRPKVKRPKEAQTKIVKLKQFYKGVKYSKDSEKKSNQKLLFNMPAFGKLNNIFSNFVLCSTILTKNLKNRKTEEFLTKEKSFKESNHFFPYRKSFFYYWLLPFVGFIACIPSSLNTPESKLFHSSDSLKKTTNYYVPNLTFNSFKFDKRLSITSSPFGSIAARAASLLAEPEATSSSGENVDLIKLKNESFNQICTFDAALCSFDKSQKLEPNLEKLTLFFHNKMSFYEFFYLQPFYTIPKTHFTAVLPSAAKQSSASFLKQHTAKNSDQPVASLAKQQALSPQDFFVPAGKKLVLASLPRTQAITNSFSTEFSTTSSIKKEIKPSEIIFFEKKNYVSSRKKAKKIKSVLNEKTSFLIGISNIKKKFLKNLDGSPADKFYNYNRSNPIISYQQASSVLDNYIKKILLEPNQTPNKTLLKQVFSAFVSSAERTIGCEAADKETGKSSNYDKQTAENRLEISLFPKNLNKYISSVLAPSAQSYIISEGNYIRKTTKKDLTTLINFNNNNKQLKLKEKLLKDILLSIHTRKKQVSVAFPSPPLFYDAKHIIKELNKNQLYKLILESFKITLNNLSPIFNYKVDSSVLPIFPLDIGEKNTQEHIRKSYNKLTLNLQPFHLDEKLYKLASPAAASSGSIYSVNEVYIGSSPSVNNQEILKLTHPLLTSNFYGATSKKTSKIISVENYPAFIFSPLGEKKRRRKDLESKCYSNKLLLEKTKKQLTKTTRSLICSKRELGYKLAYPNISNHFRFAAKHVFLQSRFKNKKSLFSSAFAHTGKSEMINVRSTLWKKKTADLIRNFAPYYKFISIKFQNCLKLGGFKTPFNLLKTYKLEKVNFRKNFLIQKVPSVLPASVTRRTASLASVLRSNKASSEAALAAMLPKGPDLKKCKRIVEKLFRSYLSFKSNLRNIKPNHLQKKSKRNFKIFSSLFCCAPFSSSLASKVGTTLQSGKGRSGEITETRDKKIVKKTIINRLKFKTYNSIYKKNILGSKFKKYFGFWRSQPHKSEKLTFSPFVKKVPSFSKSRFFTEIHFLQQIGKGAKSNLLLQNKVFFSTAAKSSSKYFSRCLLKTAPQFLTASVSSSKWREASSFLQGFEPKEAAGKQSPSGFVAGDKIASDFVTGYKVRRTLLAGSGAAGGCESGDFVPEEKNILEKRKDLQKKRRKKKLKKETRKRKKRKRSYPRPNWIRLNLYKNFIKNRFVGSSSYVFLKNPLKIFKRSPNNNRAAIGNVEFPTTWKKSIGSFCKKGKQFLQTSKNFRNAGLAEPEAASCFQYKLAPQVYTAFHLGEKAAGKNVNKQKSIIKIDSETAFKKFETRPSFLQNNFSSASFAAKHVNQEARGAASYLDERKQKKEFYNISNTVNKDLKMLFWKSYWLRSNLNPYLNKVKLYLNQIKKSTKKWEIYETLKSISFNVLGFEQRTLDNLNSKLKSSVLCSFPSKFRLKNKMLNKKFLKNSKNSFFLTNSSKWKLAIHLRDYNKIMYRRIQQVILNIKENLNLNGQNKARPYHIGRTRLKIEKQKKGLFNKIANKNNIKKIPFNSFFLETVDNLRTSWALHKTNLGSFRNKNSKVQIWEIEKNREQRKTNKTKKVVKNLSKKLNLFLFKSPKLYLNSEFTLPVPFSKKDEEERSASFGLRSEKQVKQKAQVPPSAAKREKRGHNKNHIIEMRQNKIRKPKHLQSKCYSSKLLLEEKNYKPLMKIIEISKTKANHQETKQLFFANSRSNFHRKLDSFSPSTIPEELIRSSNRSKLRQHLLRKCSMKRHIYRVNATAASCCWKHKKILSTLKYSTNNFNYWWSSNQTNYSLFLIKPLNVDFQKRPSLKKSNILYASISDQATHATSSKKKKHLVNTRYAASSYVKQTSRTDEVTHSRLTAKSDLGLLLAPPAAKQPWLLCCQRGQNFSLKQENSSIKRQFLLLKIKSFSQTSDFYKISSTFLFHFSVLITLLSISQIRDLLKFYFLLASKLSKTYVKILFWGSRFIQEIGKRTVYVPFYLVFFRNNKPLAKLFVVSLPTSNITYHPKHKLVFTKTISEMQSQNQIIGKEKYRLSGLAKPAATGYKVQTTLLAGKQSPNDFVAGSKANGDFVPGDFVTGSISAKQSEKNFKYRDKKISKNIPAFFSRFFKKNINSKVSNLLWIKNSLLLPNEATKKRPIKMAALRHFLEAFVVFDSPKGQRKKLVNKSGYAISNQWQRYRLGSQTETKFVGMGDLIYWFFFMILKKTRFIFKKLAKKTPTAASCSSIYSGGETDENKKDFVSSSSSEAALGFPNGNPKGLVKKNVFRTVKLRSLLTVNGLLWSTYKIYFFISTSFIKSLDIFENLTRSIYLFFEKPTELIVDWLAYAFLVEWASDLASTTPINVDIYLWNSFNKFSRPLRSGVSLLGLSVKNSHFQRKCYSNGLLLGEQRFLQTQDFLFPLNRLIFSLAGSVIQRRVWSFYDILVERVYQLDSDLTIHQKQGQIFWEIWGDSLIVVAENSNINISELTTLKEEQTRLIEEFENLQTNFSNKLNDSFYLPGTYFPASSASRSNNQGFSESIKERRQQFISFTSFKLYLEKVKHLFNFMNLKYNTRVLSRRLQSPKDFVCRPIKSERLYSRLLRDRLLLASPERNIEANQHNSLITVLPSAAKQNSAFFGWQSQKLQQRLFGEAKSRNVEYSNETETKKSRTILNKTLKRSTNQFLSYQGKDTDLFIELHPPRSFYSSALNTISAPSVKQPIGSMVCQIFAGIFSKQTAKNLLVVGSPGIEKSLLIQAIAGETELKMITDNANRYSMVFRGVAVGIKLLRDVFDALALQTPCLFLLEDIHVIGERRPFLISDEDNTSSSTKGSEREEIDEKNQVMYQLSKHLVSDYKKPYKGDFSLLIPTNHFCFDLFLGVAPFKMIRARPTTPLNPIFNMNPDGDQVQGGLGTKSEAKIKGANLKKNKDLAPSIFGGWLRQASPLWSGQKREQLESSVLISSLQLKSNQLLAPPSTSPFSVLILKEEKKLKQKKKVKEMPWSGLPGEELSLLSKSAYSIRVKVALLADMAMSNLSVKLDMITDLLVIIDGVKANRGFVVFATTHVPYILDPALRRPGRLDETLCLPIIPSLLNRWEILKSNLVGVYSKLSPSMDSGFYKSHFKNLPFLGGKFLGLTLDFFESYMIKGSVGSGADILTKITISEENPFQEKLIKFISSQAFKTQKKKNVRSLSYNLLKSENMNLIQIQKNQSSTASVSRTGRGAAGYKVRRTLLAGKASDTKLFNIEQLEFLFYPKSNSYLTAENRKTEKPSKSFAAKQQKKQDLNIPEMQLLTISSTEKKRKRIIKKHCQSIKSKTYFLASQTILYLLMEFSSSRCLFTEGLRSSSNRSKLWQHLLRKCSTTMEHMEKLTLCNKFEDFILKIHMNLESDNSRDGNADKMGIWRNDLIFTSLYSSEKVLKQHLLILLGGKIGELFTFPTKNYFSCEANRPFGSEATLDSEAAKGPLLRYQKDNYSKQQRAASLLRYKKVNTLSTNKKVKFSLDPEIGFMTLNGIDQTWRSGTSLLLSFIKKRYLYNKQLITPKLLYSIDNSSLFELPSPPSSNILLPAKRFENYKRHFQNISKKLSIGVQEKIHMHQQQRLFKRLYKFPVKEFFRSEIIENKLTGFGNSSLILNPLDSILEKPTSMNNYYRNIVLMRHRNYLNNQWWNGQLPEHNAEMTFLSEIDWRYTFTELNLMPAFSSFAGKRSNAAKKKLAQAGLASTEADILKKNSATGNLDSQIGDILIDFPDADQHYNPRKRRWILNTGDWGYWSNFNLPFLKKSREEIYAHYLSECFAKSYKFLDKNREILDFYATTVFQTGTFLKEIQILKTFRRFYKISR